MLKTHARFDQECRTLAKYFAGQETDSVPVHSNIQATRRLWHTSLHSSGGRQTEDESLRCRSAVERGDDVGTISATHAPCTAALPVCLLGFEPRCMPEVTP